MFYSRLLLTAAGALLLRVGFAQTTPAPASPALASPMADTAKTPATPRPMMGTDAHAAMARPR